MRLSRRHQEWTGLVPVRAWAGSAGGINQEGGPPAGHELYLGRAGMVIKQRHEARGLSLVCVPQA